MRPLALLLALVLVPLGGALPGLDNDAGSGQDAPNTVTAGAVPITPGVVYSGAYGSASDTADVYSFPASSGDAIEVAMWPAAACIAIYTPSNAVRKNTCTASAAAYAVESTQANATGTWRIALSQPIRSVTPYTFSVGVNAAAPNPTPGGVAVGDPPVRYIQPGEQVSTPSGSCTLNFAFNGTGSKAGRVVIGTAAHCFTALGQRASNPGNPNFGAVVYLGDYEGVNVGDFENGISGTQTDFAVIEVDAAFHGKVKGEVKGHPGLPTGLKAHSTVRLGDRILFSGYGLGFGATQPTREERFGVYTSGNNQNWVGYAPIISGDSGGPVLHQDCRAFGVVTHTTILLVPSMGGPWLDTAMGESGAAGWPIALRPAY